jgi:hypothetical protein
VRGWRDRRHNTKWGVFFQGDPMIAAQAVGPEPLHTRNQLDDLQLLDLMIQPADLRLLQLDAPPLHRIGLSHRFDDLNDLHPGGHALLL